MADTDACHIASCDSQCACLCCHLHEAITRQQTRNDHEGVPNANRYTMAIHVNGLNTYYLGYYFLYCDNLGQVCFI